MHAELIGFEGSVVPDRIDAAIKLIQGTTVPEAKKLPGFKGCYWWLDREVGRGGAIEVWESREARREANPRTRQLHEAVKGELRVPALVVDYYEVVGKA